MELTKVAMPEKSSRGEGESVQRETLFFKRRDKSQRRDILQGCFA